LKRVVYLTSRIQTLQQFARLADLDELAANKGISVIALLREVVARRATTEHVA
jgi:hypothetical protein